MACRMIDYKKRLKLAYKLSVILKCELPKLSRLSGEQMEYVNRGLREPTFLQACPGSGKTEVIGIKSAFEISKWKNKNGGIALLTFTNSAAKELNNRVSKYCDLNSGSHPHFIGTFDSWLHNFILHPFCHYMTKYQGKDGDKSVRIIEHDNASDFMHNYEVKIQKNGKTMPIMASEYYYKESWESLVGDTKLAKSIINNSLSSEERKLFLDVKMKFFKSGFATYSDAEFLSFKLLENYPFLQTKLAQRFPAIIIDECQDLSEVQTKLLDVIKRAGANLDFVGDLNQAIYEFRDVNPKLLKVYLDVNSFKKLHLTNNFRSNQHIVDLTSLLMEGSGEILGNIHPLSDNPCLLWQYEDHDFCELPSKFEQIITSNELNIGNCAILARGKATLEPLRLQHQKSKYSKIELLAIGLHCWSTVEKTTEDITNAISYTGKFVFQMAYGGRPDVKNQYCPEYISPIRWRIFLKDFLNVAKILYPFETNGTEITWKAWSVIVKQFLKLNWDMFDMCQQNVEDSLNKIKSPTKRGDNFVNEIYDYAPIRNALRTTTIHSVKGETLEAVLLISHKNKQSQGGHFSDWFREVGCDEEHIRFAYVACSRPQHILILAVPKLNNVDKGKLNKMGFISL